MKKILLSLMMVFCALGMSAKEFILTPSAATTIDPANADANQYDATATSWLVSQGALSGTSLKSYSLKYLIFQVDLKDLAGMTIQKAEMSYDSKCTESGKNSNVELASINPAWDVTTVTWNSLNANAQAHQISAGTGQNVKTSTVNLKENVLDYVKDHAGETVAFAIYTYTAREQQISNIKLTLDAIDADASVDVTIKYVCDGAEVKTGTTVGTKGQAVELATAEKANFMLDGKKYIYVSDNGAEVTAAEGSAVTVTVREAEIYNYSVVSSANGAAVSAGTGFEGDNQTVGYPRYQLVDGVLYEAPKTNDSKKQYNCTIALTEDNAVYNMTYNKLKESIVYYDEAENMEGLTKVTYGNVGVRASNSLAAMASADTKITTLAPGKYKIYAGVFSSAKTPAYVIKIAVGENVFEAPVTAVNNSEVASVEYELTKSTDVTLLSEGMGNNNALDYLYIEKTGDVEPAAIEVAVSNVTFEDWTSYGGPVVVDGKDAEGNYVHFEFNDGVVDPEYISYSEANFEWMYGATEGTGTMTETEDGFEIDVTATLEDGNVYHFTGSYVAPVWTLGDPIITITDETVKAVFDVTSIVKDGATVSIQPSISLTLGDETFNGGCGETDAIDGVVTIEIPLSNFALGWTTMTPEFKAGDVVTVAFTQLSVYNNFDEGGYETIWDSALSKTFDVTVSAADAIKNINAVANKNVMFNLAGQRVANAKGIVIMNGKKVVK